MQRICKLEKITVKIEGMMCGMCEAHIQDTIRTAFPSAKKVKASRARGEATFLLEDGFDEAKLKKAIEGTGYAFVCAAREPYKKRGLFGR